MPSFMEKMRLKYQLNDKLAREVRTLFHLSLSFPLLTFLFQKTFFLSLQNQELSKNKKIRFMFYGKATFN